MGSWKPPVGKHVECPQCHWWFHNSTVFKVGLVEFCSIECKNLFLLEHNEKVEVL